jgi:tetratricopeptide (TPR) repeat protein
MKATSRTALAILALLLLMGCKRTTNLGTSQKGDTPGTSQKGDTKGDGSLTQREKDIVDHSLQQSNPKMQNALELENEGNTKEAIAAWKNAATENLQSAPVFGTDKVMGMDPESLGQMLHDVTVKIRESKDNHGPLTDRGFLLSLLGEFGLAEADFTKAVNAAPDDAEAKLFRGIARLQRKKLGEALADFDKLVEQGVPKPPPKFYDPAGVYFFRGLCKGRMPDKKDQAEADLKMAAEKSGLYGKVMKLVGDPTGATEFRVHYSPFGVPDYSVWMANDSQVLRSVYLLRPMGEARLLVLWEVAVN